MVEDMHIVTSSPITLQSSRNLVLVTAKKTRKELR